MDVPIHILDGGDPSETQQVNASLFTHPRSGGLAVRPEGNSFLMTNFVRALTKILSLVLKYKSGVAQSVNHLTSAQVMISRFVGSSPTSGSELLAQSLEPALDSVPPSLSGQIGRAHV